MTKVDITYQLEESPAGEMLAAIQRAYTIYGIHALHLSSEMDELTVTYDASRLRLTDMDAELRRAGLKTRRT